VELGIKTEKISNEIEVQDADENEPDIKEIEVGEPKDGLSYDLVEEKIDLENASENEKSEDVVLQNHLIDSQLFVFSNVLPFCCEKF
jgi:hypothetical protein